MYKNKEIQRVFKHKGRMNVVLTHLKPFQQHFFTCDSCNKYGDESVNT